MPRLETVEFRYVDLIVLRSFLTNVIEKLKMKKTTYMWWTFHLVLFNLNPQRRDC